MPYLRADRPMPQMCDIAAGRVAGVGYYTAFGRNADVDSGPEDIWGGGGLYTGFPTGAGETVTIVSTSTDDAAAGTGMRTLELHGLDGSSAEQTETMTLNGTTEVTSSKTWTRIWSAHGITGGSSETNAGAITVAHSTTTANVFAVMAAGYGTSEACCYSVPAERSGALIVKRDVTVTNVLSGANKGVEMVLAHRHFGSSIYHYEESVQVSTGGGVELSRIGGFLLESGDDVILRAKSSSGSNLVVTGMMEIIIFDD